MNEDYEGIGEIVQQLFSYPEGPIVLMWLEELHCRYKFQPIVQSNHSNAALLLAYQAGKADCVIELINVAKHGIPKEENNELDGELDNLDRPI